MKNKIISLLPQCVILLILLFSLPAKAQFVDLGQDPTSTRWRQIKTENFQIIYPDFFEKNAQYLANIYEKLYAHTNSLGVRAQRMSIIVRANGGISNGNAGWAPKKSELYTTPPQTTDDAWLEHLCVHEFRHIVQYDKVNQGLSKTLFYLFGEQITMAIIGLYIPMWYLEGDATTFETSILPGGRGRSPEFLNQMKAQILEKGIYPYDKAVLGSYKDFVPNRYVMGYFLVGNSRANYGNAIWQEALTQTGRHPLSLSPFTQSIAHTLSRKRDSLWDTQHFRSLFINPDSIKQNNTHRDAKQTLYRDNFSELHQVWKREFTPPHNHFDTIPTHNLTYTNYHYPTPYTASQVIAYKEGLDEPGAFVLLEEQEEKLLTRTGTLSDYKFAVNHHTILWSEYKPHLRWEHGGRMTLVSYHLPTKRYLRYPSTNNRYAPFPVGNHWGFVEVTPDNEASIVIMDSLLQQELFRIIGQPHELFIHPSFDNKDHLLTVVISPQGKRLERINIHNGQRTAITSNTPYEMDHPVTFNNHILYRASFNGNNALYNQTSHHSFGENVLSSPFGINYPSLSPGQDTLYFSFYTANGYKPGKIATRNLLPSPPLFSTFPLAHRLTQLEDWKFSFSQDSFYTTRKYNKTTHLFNIHSWGPIFPDRDNMNLDLGIAVSSQNKLSTLYFTAGYVKGNNYPNGNWQLSATYRGLWPVFKIEFIHGKQDDFTRIDFQAIHKESGRQDTVYMINEVQRTELTFNMQLPFNLSMHNYNRSFTPYVQYELQALNGNRMKEFASWNTFHKNTWTQDNPSDYQFHTSNIRLQILQYGVSFSNQTRTAIRDIYPRWGQYIHYGYAHTPWKNLHYGHSWWTESQLYFPGVAPHHALMLYIGYQEKSAKSNYYNNKIYSPRGMKLSGFQLSTLRSGYYLPIAYPDKALGSVLYVKRLTGGVFFDTGKEKNIHQTKTFYSYGGEFLMDTHLLRLPFPMQLGLRGGYETRKNSPFINLLFTLNFSI